jgi:hypothetical protein
MKYFLNFFLLFMMFSLAQGLGLKPSLNLTRGTTYYMIGSSNSTILQTVNGQENKIDLDLSYKLAFKVTAIMDSVYNMEVRYQSIDMKVRVGDKVIEMDSRKNDKQDFPSMIIAGLINKSFTINITKSGKIQSIKNVEKVVTGVIDDFPQIDTAKKEQLKSQLLQTFGGNAFKGNLEMATAIFPETTVVKNDKWKVNTALDGKFKMDVYTTYKLTNIHGAFYQIHGDGIISTGKNARLGDINGLPMKYHLTGTSVSEIKADKITGWVSEVKVKQVMKGNVEILDNPKVPGGLNIPMTFNTEMTTTDK